MIIHIGEKPNSQINNADTTGIHKLYRLILADRPMVKVGAAINATTAGRIPLNMRSTIGPEKHARRLILIGTGKIILPLLSLIFPEGTKSGTGI